MSDWHTHVFTSTYTADVSGVCSLMYELGGMTILHDPSGCNSTYTTHDEPRWFDSKSLMFVSGLDEMAAVFGDDDVLIRDAVKACSDLHPRFITLCGASIPHIIAFDYKGVSHLIEDQTGVPVLPVPTDGMKSYVSGVGLAAREWIRRFADSDKEIQKGSVNLLGITPIDFGTEDNVKALQKELQEDGFVINGVMAYGDTFENLQNLYAGSVNVLPSSCGRMPARFMYGKKKIPYVEGLPIGSYMSEKVKDAIREAMESGRPQKAYDAAFPDAAEVLVIGEEVYAKSLASGINHETKFSAKPLWPDINEGLDEDLLAAEIRKADIVIADPLFHNIAGNKLRKMPHVGYSGRIFLKDIPVFTTKAFDISDLINERER